MTGSIDLLLAIGFLVLGIALRMGKGADLVLGKDPEIRAKYNEAESLKFFSTLLFALSACDWLCVLAGKLQNNTLLSVGVGLNIVVLVFG
ncbi:MAG: hypothetical protein RSA00_07605, partial [Hydrogenoanaerobacterium sp.]